MVLRARNIIPNLRSRTVLAGVFECSLSIDEGHDVYWEFSQINRILIFSDWSADPECVPGRPRSAPDFDFAQDISLPTVEHLITSFPLDASHDGEVIFVALCKRRTRSVGLWRLRLNKACSGRC